MEPVQLVQSQEKREHTQNTLSHSNKIYKNESSNNHRIIETMQQNNSLWNTGAVLHLFSPLPCAYLLLLLLLSRFSRVQLCTTP